MIRRNIKRQKRLTENRPDYGYSEMSLRRNRQDYGMGSQRKPIGRHHSEYTYNMFADHYNDWQDLYRTDYRTDRYSNYDSMYGTDGDETYRYQSRRAYDDDHYDNTEYSSYYDEGDTDYMDNKLHSQCRTCNKHGERRWGNMFDDSKHLYRYEEEHPRYKHTLSYNNKIKNNITNESDHPRHRNHAHIYAMHNLFGHSGFKYNKHNTLEPQHISGILSETDSDSGYRRNVTRKRKPEYKIYSTQMRNQSTGFNTKFKSLSPERLVSVTDYQEIPVLAFKNKNKRRSSLTRESDFIYLPVVMKGKNKKIHRRSFETHLKLQNSTETAEKPLEDYIKVYRAMDFEKHNIFQHKKNNGSYKNLNHFNTNQKGVNVYAVSSGPSQVFRQSAVNNLKKTKSNTSVMSSNFTEQIPDTESSIANIPNKGPSNQMTMEPNADKDSIIVPLETRIMEENRKSMADPRETKQQSTRRSGAKSSIGAVRDKSVARKSSAIGEPSFNNKDTYDTHTEGQTNKKSVARQSYVPSRSQSVVNEKESFATGKQRFVSAVPNNLNNQNTPLKSIIRRNAPQQNRSMVKKSLVVDQQDLTNQSQNQTGLTDYTDLESEDPNVQRYRSRQSIGIPKRQSNVTPRSQPTVNNESFVTQPKRSVIKGLSQQTPKRSLARQTSVTQRGQSLEGMGQITALQDQNIKKSTVRQSGVPQRGQSALARNQMEESALQSTQKSLAKQSIAAQNSQVFGNRDLIIGVEEKNQKSIARESKVSKRGQSSMNRDQVMETQGQSLVRQSKAPQSVPSFIDGNQENGVENKFAKKSMTRGSMARQSNLPKRGQSNIDRGQIMQTQGQSLVRQSKAPQSVIDGNQENGVQNQFAKKSMIRGSMARQSSVPKGGQSTLNRDHIMENQKQSLVRQSNEPQNVSRFIEGNQETGIENHFAQKSMTRGSQIAKRNQSLVDTDNSMVREGQGTNKSLERQSNARQRDQSLADRINPLGTEGKSTQKSLRKQSNVAERDQLIGGQKTQKSNVQEIDTQGPQFQTSALSREGQQRGSVARQQTFINEQGNVDNVQQSGARSKLSGSNPKQLRQSVGSKPPTKTKSKTFMKGAFSKLGPFSRRGEKKYQDSTSTDPMLDVIMRESISQMKTQNQQPLSNVGSDRSSGATKQSIQTKPKKSSAKSKLSKLSKNLLRRSKKSDIKQKKPSNIEDVKRTEQYTDQQRADTDYIPTSEETFSDNNSEELKGFFGYPVDNLPPTLKGYDLTSAIIFLQFAQFIVGVALYDKLMEVFAFL